MQILVVAAFVTVLGLMEGGGQWPAGRPGWVLAAGAAAYIAVAYGATRLGTWLCLRRLIRRGALGRLPGLLALASHVYLLAALALLMLSGWGSLIERALHLGRVPLAGKVAALAPFVGALVAYWWAVYPLERAMRTRLQAEMALADMPVLPVWTLRQYLSFHLRYSLLFVGVPAGAMVFALDVLFLLEPRLGAAATGAAAVGAGGAMFVLAPAMIVRIWRTRPLPDGPLRDRLEGLCRRMRLRHRDILVWETDGVIVNAAVMGLIGPLRYVLLSDALVQELPPEEVESIFAHEAGHVVHHHIPYMVAFTAGLGMVCTGGVEAVAAALSLTRQVDLIPIVVAAAGVWAWAFGLLSRRFERQADAFAAGAVPAPAGGSPAGELTPQGVELFGQALMTVARMNGIPLKQRNFRHGSIRRRLEVLRMLLATGKGRTFLDARARAIKLAILALLAAGVAATLLVARGG